MLTTSKKGKEKANYKAYKASSKQQKRGLDWKINELFNYKIMIESIEIIYLWYNLRTVYKYLHKHRYTIHNQCISAHALIRIITLIITKTNTHMESFSPSQRSFLFFILSILVIFKISTSAEAPLAGTFLCLHLKWRSYLNVLKILKYHIQLLTLLPYPLILFIPYLSIPSILSIERNT